MTNKIDQILDHVIEIKEDIAGMKQELKSQNGSIKRNIKEIDELYTKSNSNREELGKLKSMINTIGVGITLISTFVATFISKLWK